VYPKTYRFHFSKINALQFCVRNVPILVNDEFLVFHQRGGHCFPETVIVRGDIRKTFGEVILHDGESNHRRSITGVSSADAKVNTGAHHSHAMFDMTKDVSITGTVTNYSYRNPHVFLYLDVKGDNGEAGDSRRTGPILRDPSGSW